MDTITAVLFEPVGCLAEFHTHEFDEAVQILEPMITDGSINGSVAYWRLLGLLGSHKEHLKDSLRIRLQELELAAVEAADLYEDVRPSLERLRAAGVGTYLVSSLSELAVSRFVARFALSDLFDCTVSREAAGGVMAEPLRHIIAKAVLKPQCTVYLVDNATALEMTKRERLQTLLMINDHDEGRALADLNPAGGVVSLAELGDALQVIDQRAGLRTTSRAPLRPFQLFEA